MYVAIEQKVKLDGTYETSKYNKETRDEAERAFHSILAVAATSEHLIHSATILNAEGQMIKTECYKHAAPAPEPEPEEEPAEEPEETQAGEE